MAETELILRSSAMLNIMVQIKNVRHFVHRMCIITPEFDTEGGDCGVDCLRGTRCLT
jgi:hypothetical protein